MKGFLLLAGAAVVAAQSAQPTVDLGYARYRGVNNATSGINSFYGIHYAAAPIGNLRWQAPVDIERSNDYASAGIIDASSGGPACYNSIPSTLGTLSPPVSAFGANGESEDCLLLDVLVPDNPTSAYLPVLVQIHGGGYTLGAAGFFPGDALVNRSAGNLIYVSIQYRLGAFGFLAGAAVRENGVANAGLLDQRAALNWIQRNIRAFGGDPARVTITGGSAGGGSMTMQMILYGGVTNPPFRAVIAEYPWWQPLYDESYLNSQYNDFVQVANCTNLACLRGLSSEQLQQANINSYNTATAQMMLAYGVFYWGPSIDGEAVRDLPSNEFKQGHFTKVPLIVNRNGYEGVIFTNISETTVAAQRADFMELWPTAGPAFFTRLYQLYPASNFNATFWQRQQIFGDFIINCPTYYMATAASDAGLDVYKMLFYAGSELHGATIPFLFSNVTNPAVNNVTLAGIMQDYFVSFAVTLNPNTYSLSGQPNPLWPFYQSWDGQTFNVLNVQYTSISTANDFDASPQCDFFHGQSYVVRN